MRPRQSAERANLQSLQRYAKRLGTDLDCLGAQCQEAMRYTDLSLLSRLPSPQKQFLTLTQRTWYMSVFRARIHRLARAYTGTCTYDTGLYVCCRCEFMMRGPCWNRSSKHEYAPAYRAGRPAVRQIVVQQCHALMNSRSLAEPMSTARRVRIMSSG